MDQGREAKAGVGGLSRNGGAQGRLPGCREEWAAGCALDVLWGLQGPREMDESWRGSGWQPHGAGRGSCPSKGCGSAG